MRLRHPVMIVRVIGFVGCRSIMRTGIDAATERTCAVRNEVAIACMPINVARSEMAEARTGGQWPTGRVPRGSLGHATPPMQAHSCSTECG